MMAQEKEAMEQGIERVVRHGVFDGVVAAHRLVHDLLE